MNSGMDRVAELKARVDELKDEVRRAQDNLTLLRGAYDPHGGRRTYYQRIDEAKKRWNDAVRRLQDAKTQLVRVTGTTGSDPRWGLIRDAWRLLQRLEDSGVELGDDGRKLLDGIEFHIGADRRARTWANRRGVQCTVATRSPRLVLSGPDRTTGGGLSGICLFKIRDSWTGPNPGAFYDAWMAMRIFETTGRRGCSEALATEWATWWHRYYKAEVDGTPLPEQPKWPTSIRALDAIRFRPRLPHRDGRVRRFA